MQKVNKWRNTHRKKPMLHFSPYAWAKLLFFRDFGDTEIGGFGITDADDLLYVKDFVTVKQEVTNSFVSFDDEAVAEYFEHQVDQGLQPEQFARIWIHSHPGMSPKPSSVDVETFSRVFGNCHWSIIFIISSSGKYYARIRYNQGPSATYKLRTGIDYAKAFQSSNVEKWKAEYQQNIIQVPMFKENLISENDEPYLVQSAGYDLVCDVLGWLDDMEPFERKIFLDELASRLDLWEDVDRVLLQ